MTFIWGWLHKKKSPANNQKNYLKNWFSTSPLKSHSDLVKTIQRFSISISISTNIYLANRTHDISNTQVKHMTKKGSDIVVEKYIIKLTPDNLMVPHLIPVTDFRFVNADDKFIWYVAQNQIKVGDICAITSNTRATLLWDTGFGGLFKCLKFSALHNDV